MSVKCVTTLLSYSQYSLWLAEPHLGINTSLSVISLTLSAWGQLWILLLYHPHTLLRTHTCTTLLITDDTCCTVWFNLCFVNKLSLLSASSFVSWAVTNEPPLSSYNTTNENQQENHLEYGRRVVTNVRCLETFILPAGTTMGGGLGAMMWGADGGMGTTLMRGAGIMGGIDAMTCPGARRTTGATGGLGITGTADRRVVRTGATCWQRILKLAVSLFNLIHLPMTSF